MPPLPTLPRWLPATLFAVALASALWRIPQVAAPAFLPPPAPLASPLPAQFAAQPLPGAGLFAGAPSLVQLPDGRLGVAWLAGSSADADDLAIHFSSLGRDGWSKPQPIANRESSAAGLFAHVRRVGRPRLLAEGSWLHLWYAAIGIGGSANVALAHSVSTDGGRQWSKPQRLPLSPLAGYGTAPGGPPLALADGGVALPLQHDLFAGQGEWLRLSATGRVVDKLRLEHPARAPQPAVAVLDERRALALLRDAGPPPGRLRAARSDDGGQSWQAAPDPGPANPDTPVAVLRLPSGRLLLAGNPAAGRGTLALWLSADDGRSWQAARSVETAADGAADFSEPDLLLGRDGRIHLAYSRRAQGIRHVSFSEAWLAGGQP